MEKIKELLKNKKIVAGTIAGLAVVVILIIVIAVSCGKNDDEKNTEKSRENTTAAKVEKNTADEETTEPESETESVTNVTENSSTEDNTTEQLTKVAEEATTLYIEPETEAPTPQPTQAPTEAPTPAPTQAVEQPQHEAPVFTKHDYSTWSDDKINVVDEEVIVFNADETDGAAVFPFKLYDIDNLVTRKYTNGNGNYVTYLGFYELDYMNNEEACQISNEIAQARGYETIYDFYDAEVNTANLDHGGFYIGTYGDVGEVYFTGKIIEY